MTRGRVSCAAGRLNGGMCSAARVGRDDRTSRVDAARKERRKRVRIGHVSGGYESKFMSANRDRGHGYTPAMNTLLTPIEARVIGCLIEKQITTPDQYPL